MFEIKNLTANYGGLAALKEVSLTFAKGERVAIFGHNGAGKTTLLRCGVGAHANISGEIRFRGASIVPGDVPRNVRLGIGFVPQGHNVFPTLPVERNLHIAGLMNNNTDIGQVYDLFPMLKPRRNQLAGSMSGGEQQMLALGMALMIHPGVLLLDEPTTGLAPVIVRDVMNSLMTINKSYSTTIVMVEQNVPAAAKMAERAVVLKSGRVVFDGSSDELLGQKDLWAWF